jgi:hypothetical protein
MNGGAMFGLNEKIVNQIKKEYPIGTRVKLVRMDDPYAKITIGTKGTVSNVDDIGTIHVKWDTGHHLGIAYGEDECEILPTIKTICYGKEDVWDSRDEAMRFFLQAMAGSEGSEQNRYGTIVAKLEMGLDICSDED